MSVSLAPTKSQVRSIQYRVLSVEYSEWSPYAPIVLEIPYGPSMEMFAPTNVLNACPSLIHFTNHCPSHSHGLHMIEG